MTAPATIRLSTPEDAAVLAALDGEAWRYAYRGIIPGLTLERMIARRGPAWWKRRNEERRNEIGGRALLIEFDGRVVGYASFGPCRMRGAGSLGEIYELYMKPEAQGAGFGRRLFVEARRRLRECRRRGLLVWALAENEQACRFYEALGGRERVRTREPIGDVRLVKVAYVWGEPAA